MRCSIVAVICFAFFLTAFAVAEDVQSQSQEAPSYKIHKVWIWQESGDCLWALAKKYYGDPWQWKKIYLANKHQMDNPSTIYPKQSLIIPIEKKSE